TGLGSCLGVGWQLESDHIVFELPSLPQGKLIRRSLASTFAKNFDPLGLLGSNQTRLKLFLRDVVIRDKAQALIDDVKHLAKLHIHRVAMSSSDWELRLFGDASKFAYGI